ncbi:Protein CBR-INS-2 [Caenorhabditis briggsae]|uniref:Uncharacterized protein n=2 Tax=Caenorhabditis briggsae TaxID=6238 RepID=A0AAE9J896_CAEBR|nr:Protein CBR-INS-2 [Caenorhabditis briggsae]ULU06710.1 hypothetical protein L3Y34_018491 [Caenorhabditis briggsae]UMM18642.1 hypothetical protein L5515_014609 [Caenorhabditis briggsae]CAP23984.1 Protein CBR-INS-2 [Caenorhabditis briggsae]
MNAQVLVLLLILDIGAAATNFDYLNDHLEINELKNNQVEHPELKHLTSTRASRFQENKIRFCGRRLALFIFATCGECQTDSGTDLSVLCCAQPCNIKTIIDACCPDTHFK